MAHPWPVRLRASHHRRAARRRAALPRVAAAAGICSTRKVAASPRPSALAPPRVPKADPVAPDTVDELIKAHYRYVARLAYRLLGRDDEVDDVLQDVFLAFFRFHIRIRDQRAVRGWLATTTVRVSHKRLRARARRPSLSVENDVDQASMRAPGGSPEDHAMLFRVHRALANVPPKARVAWALRYLEQERIEDVARLCRCSLATAKRRIAAAHSVVKRALAGDD